MSQTDKKYTCERCGGEITEEEHETYDGMCKECYEIEIDELTMKTTTNILVIFLKKQRSY